MTRLVVIDGGVSGLAAAGLAARNGHSVDLIERGEQLGGRAGRRESAGFTFDTGPSWYLMPEVFDRFLRLFGTSASEALDLVRRDPGLAVPTNVYVSATSRTDPTTAPKGGENLFVLVPCPADPSLKAGSPEVEECVDAVLDQVGGMGRHSRPARVDRHSAHERSR